MLHLVTSFSLNTERFFNISNEFSYISCTRSYQFFIIILDLFNFIVFSLRSLLQNFFVSECRWRCYYCIICSCKIFNRHVFWHPAWSFFSKLFQILVNHLERIVFIIDCNCLIFLWNFSFLETIDDFGLANMLIQATAKLLTMIPSVVSY